MSFNDFIKNDNKSIIWGLLQEGGVFNDIPNNMFDNVKRLFESSILSMKPEFDVFFDKNDEGDDDYDKKASDMIINSNKTVIKKMIEEIKKFKHPNVNQNSNMKLPIQQQPSQMLHVPPRFDMNPTRDTNKIGSGSGGGKKPKIEEIYRADDLQKNRMSELEIRLKEKQQEMDLMLNNKKPESIDFSDSKLNDNKLASDEMERLLAEALSSRNRELEIISMNTNDVSSKVAEEWITGSTDPVAKAVNASINIKRSNDIKRPIEKINTAPASIPKKNVSFNENHNEQITIPYEKETNEKETNDNENTNLSFLSKLKVKNPVADSQTHTISLDDYNAESNDDNNYHSVGNDDDNNAADDHIGMRMYTIEKPRGATGAGDYEKLYNTIQQMQNDIDLVKKTQEQILELLQSK